VKEHRIAFCTEMVRAYQRGQKTQTRRADTGQEPYAVGDVLLIGEKLVRIEWTQKPGGDKFWTPGYAADGELVRDEKYLPYGDWPWKFKVIPARYCPKWAVRYRAEVVEVRHRRVQEISEADAAAEGIHDYRQMDYYIPGELRQQYRVLWDSLNAKRDDGKYRWHSNPYVWAYTFRPLEAPQCC